MSEIAHIPARAKAEAILRGLLAHGAHPTTELHEAARAAGISPATLRRVAKGLGVERHGPRPEALWSLPEAPLPVQVPALLADVLTALGERDRLHTVELLAALRAREPWATLWAGLDWREAAKRLALGLEPHGVRPARVGVGDRKAQGYRRAEVLAAVHRADRRAA